MNKKDFLKKLQFLRREETEYYQKASIAEAIDILIQCCEFLMNDQPERLNPKACDYSGINIMQHLDENSEKCKKCGSIFTRFDSPTLGYKESLGS